MQKTKLTEKYVIELAIQKAGGVAPLAKTLGVSESFIRKIKGGFNKIPFKKINDVAELTEPEITAYQIFDIRTKR